MSLRVVLLTWAFIIAVGWLFSGPTESDQNVGKVAPPTVAERPTIEQTAETTGTATIFATARK